VRDELAKYVIGSRKYREEVLGEVLPEAAGALWQQAWIDRTRVPHAPALAHSIVAVDPALSTAPEADETGIVVVGRAERKAYVMSDLSGRHAPEIWGDLVVSQCIDHGAAGVAVERNHACEFPSYVLRSRASGRGWGVVVIAPSDRTPIPSRQHGTIYVREIQATRSKASRASPVASEHEAGRVHVVGQHAALERELTAWTPGSKSPGRLDAMVHGVTEILELWRDRSVSGRACVALPSLRIGRSARRIA